MKVNLEKAAKGYERQEREMAKLKKITDPAVHKAVSRLLAEHNDTITDRFFQYIKPTDYVYGKRLQRLVARMTVKLCSARYKN